MINFQGESLIMKFQPPFDLGQYENFLQSKKLPESNLTYNWRDRSYTLEAPARYARLFGLEPPRPNRSPLPLHPDLLDRQAFAVSQALSAKRFAVWYDTGLGKTLIELEFARQVAHITGGRVLLIIPLNIISQTLEEAARFYGDDLPIVDLLSRDDMKDWCKSGAPGLAVTNPEKFIPRDGEEFIPEIQYLAGVVLDESSLLKTGGGKIKWAMIKSCRGVEYKLSCTATPAPNDSMEYASQASFLEKLRHEGEILWTYFFKTKEGEWKIKEHAKAGFYRFLAGWSLYMRNPAVFGFDDDLKDIPRPDIREHLIEPTPEQLAAAGQAGDSRGQGSLFIKTESLALQERILYSEIAKGFLYRGKGTERIPSRKPGFVADLARADLADGRQVLIWTKFDEESDILRELLADVEGLECLSGRTPKDRRPEVIERFRTGRTPLLISKAEILGYGLNFQNCASMIFSGFDDSYERFYQAVRRCLRYGQTRVDAVDIYSRTSQESYGEGGAPDTPNILSDGCGRGYSSKSPFHLRASDGIPDWTYQVGALGNAIVPQVAYEIGRAILLADAGREG